MESVYSSSGLYVKSLCIDELVRSYKGSRLNCLKQGMQLYRADSPEAIAVIFNIVYEQWTVQNWYVRLHIAANASGPLFIGNMNPTWTTEITTGNSTAQSVCEFVQHDCKFVQKKIYKEKSRDSNNVSFIIIIIKKMDLKS
jgi:hypothetical protein